MKKKNKLIQILFKGSIFVTMFVEINPYNIDKRLIQSAVDCLRKGELIIFPTDTVYAIGCDIRNKKAINELAKWKNEKLSKTNFSFICKDLSEVSEYVKQLDRKEIREHALENYTVDIAAEKYEKYFHRLEKLWGDGWYEISGN